MATLTVCNHKGGTGKTTSSVHLAAAFGLMGHRVLVVDLDPQGFLTRTLGADEPTPEASSLALLDADGDLRRTPVQRLRHFDLLGSSMTMTREQRRLTRPTDVFWMRETLAQGHDYDLVLIDTAAAVSVFTMNALVASDAVVIPVTPEYQPVVGAEQTWQTCKLVRSKLNPGLQEPRFLLTQVDGRLSRHTRYTDYLRDRYKEAVLGVPIRTSSSLAVAARDGRTVFNAQRMTRGAVDYANSAAEIAAHFFPPLARPAPISGAPDEAEDLDHADVVESDVAEQASQETPPVPEFGAIPLPAPSDRPPPFRHAPIPGKAAPIPGSMPAAAQAVAETLAETKRVAESAAHEAELAIRAKLPADVPPPRNGGNGAPANGRRLGF